MARAAKKKAAPKKSAPKTAAKAPVVKLVPKVASGPSFEKRIAQLEHQIGILEDKDAIKTLHYKYGYYIDKCMWVEAVDLFADDAEVRFANGIYKGKKGAHRLYVGWFQKLFTGGYNGPIYGFLLEHMIFQFIIDVAPDRKTAKARGRGFLLGGVHRTKKDPIPGVPDQFLEAAGVDAARRSGHAREGAQFPAPGGAFPRAQVQVLQAQGIGDEAELRGPGIVNHGGKGAVPRLGLSGREIGRQFLAGNRTPIAERLAVHPGLDSLRPHPVRARGSGSPQHQPRGQGAVAKNRQGPVVRMMAQALQQIAQPGFRVFRAPGREAA